MSAVDSWFAASSGAVAEPLPKPRARRRTPAKATTRSKQRRGFRVRAPLVWMAVFAVLLVGIVTLNVAVLRANVSVNNLDAQITQHQQELASLKTRLARATAAPRIARLAAREGDVQVSSNDTGTVDLARHK